MGCGFLFEVGLFLSYVLAGGTGGFFISANFSPRVLKHKRNSGYLSLKCHAKWIIRILFNVTENYFLPELWCQRLQEIKDFF